MWNVTQDELSGHRGYKLSLLWNNAPARIEQVINAWQHDGSFRDYFHSLVASTPYEAIRWETPPVTLETCGLPFECVLLESLELLKTADSSSFSEHFRNAKQDGVVTFENLGRDALLVVPTPPATKITSPHLKAFAEHASSRQTHAFWQAVGQSFATRLNQKPIWLNTAGAAVPWLHLRIDSRPKYFRYQPYAITS